MVQKHEISNQSIKLEENSINIDPEDRETNTQLGDKLVH